MVCINLKILLRIMAQVEEELPHIEEVDHSAEVQPQRSSTPSPQASPSLDPLTTSPAPQTTPTSSSPTSPTVVVEIETAQPVEDDHGKG